MILKTKYLEGTEFSVKMKKFLEKKLTDSDLLVYELTPGISKNPCINKTVPSLLAVTVEDVRLRAILRIELNPAVLRLSEILSHKNLGYTEQKTGNFLVENQILLVEYTKNICVQCDCWK